MYTYIYIYIYHWRRSPRRCVQRAQAAEWSQATRQAGNAAACRAAHYPPAAAIPIFVSFFVIFFSC